MKNLIILLCLILYSCGVRKVQKSETKTEIKTEIVQTENTKDSISINQTETKTETKTENLTVQNAVEKYVITPIDSTKEIILTDSDGKITKFKNAKIEKVKKTHFKAIKNEINTNTLKSKDSVSKQTKISNKIENTNVASETFNKETVHKGFDFCWIIIILSVIGSIILYRSIKKDS
jgi:hypothetical protein